MFNPVGKFTEPFESSVGILYVRGLKVSEFLDLTRQGFFNRSSFATQDYVRIAYACVEGWEPEDLDDYEKVDDVVQVLEALGLDEVVEIGKFAIEEMTNVTDELESMARGYTRFLHLGEDDRGKAIVESYNCKKCLLNGYYDSRKAFCGRFTPEEAEDVKAELQGIEKASKESVKTGTGVTKDRYSARRKQRRGSKKPKKVSHIFLNDFKFPECPASWIPDWLWQAGSILYHSDKSNIPFFSGGLADQPYQLYRLSRIIGGESSTIEEEKRKKNG